MRDYFLIVAAVAFAVILPYLASAMEGSYAQDLSCRIDFNVAVMNSMISVSPANSTSGLQSSVTTLTNDKSQLQNLTNTTDYKGFNQQYANDMKGVRQTVSLWRRSFGENLTLSNKGTLVSSYSAAETAFNQCRVGSLQQMGQNRITNYQKQISQFQNVSDRLASKGFDASSLNTLLQDAQTTIVQPLQSAISAANDSASMQQALESYCLFDGCTNGTNFHLEAKFDWTKYNIVYQDLQNNSAAFNLSTSMLSQAAQGLSNAQTTLSQVGTSAYQPTQSQTIESSLKSVAQALSSLIEEVNKQVNVGLK